MSNESPEGRPEEIGGVAFFLGQISGRMDALADETKKASASARAAEQKTATLPQDVVKLIGPRFASLEGRVANLEAWRLWLTGVVACLGFLGVLAAVLKYLP